MHDCNSNRELLKGDWLDALKTPAIHSRSSIASKMSVEPNTNETYTKVVLQQPVNIAFFRIMLIYRTIILRYRFLIQTNTNVQHSLTNYKWFILVRQYDHSNLIYTDIVYASTFLSTSLCHLPSSETKKICFVMFHTKH